MIEWRRFGRVAVEPKPLCGIDIPNRLPSVSWFCAKLNMSSTDVDKLSRLNNNCPGCVTEAHEIGKCKANPHRRAG